MTVKELLGPKNYYAATVIRIYNGGDFIDFKSDREAFTSNVNCFDHSSIGKVYKQFGDCKITSWDVSLTQDNNIIIEIWVEE